jgi:hypothetical protein
MFKLLHSDLSHNGFQYQVGLNVDSRPFNPHGSCEPGGLYYTDLAHLALFLSDAWPLVADVTVPDDALVYPEPDGTKWKASQLVLSNLRPVVQLLAELPHHMLLMMAKQSPRVLRLLNPVPPDVFLTALLSHRCALSFLSQEQLTPELCVLAHDSGRLFHRTRTWLLMSKSHCMALDAARPGWRDPFDTYISATKASYGF